MRLRNNIFAAALDEMKRRKIVKTQKELAKLMEVSEDTITRILKDRTEVTEDIITKLQTASGCIFNLQWLRGEDAFHMLAIDVNKEKENYIGGELHLDISSVINTIIAAKDETIATKEKLIASQAETIAVLKSRISDLERQIANSNLSDIYKYPFAIGAAEDGEKPRI